MKEINCKILTADVQGLAAYNGTTEMSTMSNVQVINY